MNIKKITICSVFAALICVGSYLRIPIPLVPITLQVFFVLLAGLTLNKKMAFTSCFIYVLLGLIGIPVFSGGGGFLYVIKPTFGYIIGFLISSFVMPIICYNKNTYSFKIIASIVGIFIIYFVGIVYFYIISKLIINSQIDIKTLITTCFLIPIPSDIISAIFAIFISKKLAPIVKI